MSQSIFIELCNFVDWPIGGHLSFARHLARAMQGELRLVGVATESAEPVGEWFEKVVEGHRYRFYNVGRGNVSSGRPLVPSRLRHFMLLRSHVRKLQLQDYDRIIVQTPEVLLNIPRPLLPRVVLVMPGLSNPLGISRYAWARRLAPVYDRVFLSRARHVNRLLCAADGEAIGRFVASTHGRLDAARVCSFPTRYDADIFHPRIKETSAADAPRLLTTGRLTWLKGWKLMIDALAELLTTHPLAHLTFIGDGEDHDRIEAYIAQRGLGAHITLAGRMAPERLAESVARADCFVMGSEVEGWSTSLVEAVASGVPCVVTRFSSATEMVTDGLNGYVLQGRTPEEFAARIRDALILAPGGVADKADEAFALYSVQSMRSQFCKLVHD